MNIPRHTETIEVATMDLGLGHYEMRGWPGLQRLAAANRPGAAAGGGRAGRAVAMHVHVHAFDGKALGHSGWTRLAAWQAVDAPTVVAVEVWVAVVPALGTQQREAADAVGADRARQQSCFGATVEGAVQRHTVQRLWQQGFDVGVAERSLRHLHRLQDQQTRRRDAQAGAGQQAAVAGFAVSGGFGAGVLYSGHVPPL